MSDIWITKDGREIPYEDLEDDHLLNIIKMLKNNAGWTESQKFLCAVRMDAYIEDAPDGAAMCCEMEMNNMLRDPDWEPPALVALREEAERRGLEVAQCQK